MGAGLSGASRYRFGPFELDRRRLSLTEHGRPIHLKPKEWELLCCLVENRDRVLSKDELLDALWPRQTVTEANLSQAVYAVRKALGDSARDAKWIETVPRQGYRFVAPDGEGGAAGEPSVSSEARISPAARAAYERGRYCWRRFTEAGLRQAMAFFDEALEAEPRFAQAHAWRSATWSALGNIGALTPRNSAEHARRAADRAIAIDDTLATGYEMRGVVELYFDWNFEAALRSFDRAIAREPRSANAHHLRANALAFAGDFDAARAGIGRALDIDPTSLITRTDAGLVDYLAGDFESAGQALQSVLDQDPVFPHARLKLAFVLMALGKQAAAVEECERAAKGLDNADFGARACMLGLAGRTRQANDVVRRLAAEVERGTADPYGVALGHLGLGNFDRALDWLARAVEFRSRDLVLLQTDPVWYPLRSRKAFSELVEMIGYR